MACDTFIKIARQCKRHFVALQPGETEPFIEEIVRTMRKITCDLSPQQVHTFYEACGYMIAAQPQKNAQERLIAELMSYPNAAWDTIIAQANANPAILQDGDTIKVIGNVMKTNVSACTSIGSYFYPQIGRIYLDMLSMYRATSQMISESVTRDGKIPKPAPFSCNINSAQERLRPRRQKFGGFAPLRKKSSNSLRHTLTRLMTSKWSALTLFLHYLKQYWSIIIAMFPMLETPKY
jgi:hypothetical protein